MTVVDDGVFFWHEGVEVPGGLPVVQVCGWVFDEWGRVGVLNAGVAWSLPGGGPDRVDAGDVGVTLAREVWEEIQVEIDPPVYLGYQRVRGPGTAVVAQVRMAARVRMVGPRMADPDKGRVHVRRFCPVDEALVLLGWGAPAAAQARAALRVAGTMWGLPVKAAVEGHTD